MRHLIGIDEAGRGPLAGPVAVGAVMAREDFDVLSVFPDVRDSKVLSPKKREDIYERIEAHAVSGDITFSVQFRDSAYIDEHGITQAVKMSLDKCIEALSPDPSGVRVLLDGLLHAPDTYEQKTIIRGDALVPLISLASIVAKVRRDRLMQTLAKTYPLYGLESHKGYGTEYHRSMIRTHGLSEIHRRSFCRGLIPGL